MYFCRSFRSASGVSAGPLSPQKTRLMSAVTSKNDRVNGSRRLISQSGNRSFAPSRGTNVLWMERLQASGSR